MKKRGNGASGGGLEARQKWFDQEAAKSGGMMPDGNGNRKCKYHRPGSQNKRK